MKICLKIGLALKKCFSVGSATSVLCNKRETSFNRYATASHDIQIYQMYLRSPHQDIWKSFTAHLSCLFIMR